MAQGAVTRIFPLEGGWGVCRRAPVSPLLQVGSTPGGGGGVMRAKRVCVPKMGLSFLALVQNFIFPSRKIFLGSRLVGPKMGCLPPS